MAFVSEEIREQDREYFDSIGFTNIFDEPSKADWWAIDKQRDIILICRGGMPHEPIWGYQLYLCGELVNMEALERAKGSQFRNNLRVHWIIKSIEVPEKLYKKGCDIDKIKQNIKEAFIGYGTIGIEHSKLAEITVEIDADIKNKGDDVRKGM